MPVTLPTQRVDFRSDGTRCSAWLTLPPGAGPHPAVVLVHGFGATHDMMLPQYEQHFAAAGIATLAFDYRYTGASDGEPRQHISLRKQRADVAAALALAMSRPEIDATRVGLWGTSLGGMNVVRVAAARNDVAAAVVQCPIVHGPAAARTLGVAAPLRLAPMIAEDGLRALLRPGAALRADRRTAGQRRRGHRRRRRGRMEFDGSARRAIRQPGRRGRRRRDGGDIGTSAGPKHRRAAAGVRVRPREPHRPEVRRAGGPTGAPRRRPPLRLRPFRDLPSAVGPAGARRPDRLSARSISMSVRDLSAATTTRDSWPSRRASAPTTGRAPSLCERLDQPRACSPIWWSGSARRWAPSCARWCRHRGSFDDANIELARALAAVRRPAELLDDFARLQPTNPGALGRYFPPRLMLGDHVTHELDIVYALDRKPDDIGGCLGRRAEYPSGAAQSVRACIPQQSRGCGCGATDVGWTTVGADPRSRAVPPNWCQCSATARRRCHDFRGDGVAVLASRAQPPDPYGRVRISR